VSQRANKQNEDALLSTRDDNTNRTALSYSWATWQVWIVRSTLIGYYKKVK
jgi:hypothetical protein